MTASHASQTSTSQVQAAAPSAAPTTSVAPAPSVRAPYEQRVCWPWLVVMVVVVGVIWGNSMVPGDESGALSSGVLAWIQQTMTSASLPIAWLTEHIVRKAAHFTEYLCLGLVTMQALRPHRAPAGRRAAKALLTVLLLVLVPLADETIQLFSDGRGSMVSDVWIDIAGAMTGCALTLLASRLFGALRPARA